MRTLQEIHEFIESKITHCKEREICREVIKSQELIESSDLLDLEMSLLLVRLEHGASNFTYENWGPKEYKYLSQRATTVKNQKLIARYNQLLFNGDRKYKRRENAINAIEAYLNILANGLFGIWTVERIESLYYIEVISNMLGLLSAISNFDERVIKEQITIVFETRIQQSNSHKYILISTLLEYPQIYKARDLAGFQEILEDAIKEYWADNNFFTAPHVIEAGIKISNKLNQDNKKWYELLGQNYEQFAELRKDDRTGMIPPMMINNAIIAYQKSGNKTKVEELGAIYPSLAEKVKLTSFKWKLDERLAQQLSDMIDKQVGMLIPTGSDAIYEYLKFHLYLPDKEYLLKVNNPLRDQFELFTKIGFDINKNIIPNPETKEDQEKEKMQNAYSVHNRFVVWPLVNEIFVSGIRQNTLSIENLECVLRNSWLGNELFETDLSGNDVQYNWMDSIMPGLRIVLSELEKGIITEDYNPDILAGVDSLVIKFEGILRDMAWALKLNTKKVDSRSNSLREIYIDDLLRLPKLEEIFDDGDLLFFKFVYTKFGINLRNNISHGFYRKHQYNIHQAYLIILSLLRLSKYNVVPQAQPE